MFKYETTIDELAGLYKITGTLSLPEITLVRHMHNRETAKYDIQRAFTELVEQIIEKEFEND